MRDPSIDATLLESLSADRLSKYLERSGKSLGGAIDLYEKNTSLSEAFYTPLHCLEITLRNRLDKRMEARFGPAWLTKPDVPLADDARLTIDKARRSLGRGEHAHGAIVAELGLGFWVGLMATRYDATIWRSTLHAAFRIEGRGPNRSVVHGRMNALRRFRNRVAHHEPIFDRDLIATHQEIIEAINWMCPRTARWAESLSRVPDLVTRRDVE